MPALSQRPRGVPSGLPWGIFVQAHGNTSGERKRRPLDCSNCTSFDVFTARSLDRVSRPLPATFLYLLFLKCLRENRREAGHFWHGHCFREKRPDHKKEAKVGCWFGKRGGSPTALLRSPPSARWPRWLIWRSRPPDPQSPWRLRGRHLDTLLPSPSCLGPNQRTPQ